MSNLTAEEQKRFDACWTQEGECHVWNRSRDRDGYGTFYFRRRNRRAHRVAYYSLHGEVPEGHVVSQTCQNPSCVNPQHLRTASRSDHALEPSASPAYVNSQKTHCRNGHPYNRKYGKQRYCSTCEAEKSTRLRQKWRAEDVLSV